jgi:catechol 2,3-dioxygenase-like lactoylglutathione lyase family enzyme
MIRIQGISHVELPVRDTGDIDRAVRFYGDVFGFEVVVRGGDRVLLQTPAGSGSIALRLAGEVDPLSAAQFGLGLADPGELDAALRLVVACGGLLVERTDHAVGGTTAVVADPSGHRITL